MIALLKGFVKISPTLSPACRQVAGAGVSSHWKTCGFISSSKELSGGHASGFFGSNVRNHGHCAAINGPGRRLARWAQSVLC